MKITVATTVQAPVTDVWRAYTTPADICQWNAASDDWHTTSAAVDLREGGQFSSRMEARDGSMGFDFAGTYTRVEAPTRLEYAFGERTAQVTFAEEAGGVRVQVVFDAEDEHPAEMQQQGWQAILDNFRRHVEAGLTSARPAPRSALNQLVRSHDVPWKPLDEPGVTGVAVKVLRYDAEARRAPTILLKFEPGARYPVHNHPAGEEIYVLEGDIRLGKDVLGVGDYLFTAPGNAHAVVSQGGCVVLVQVPAEVEILARRSGQE